MKNDYLFITSKKKLYKIHIYSIHFVEALDDYVKVHLKDADALVTRMTMKAMLEQLGSEFIRVHRSFIVPLKQIEAVGTNTVVVAGAEVAVGKKYSEDVLKAFRKSR